MATRETIAAPEETRTQRMESRPTPDARTITEFLDGRWAKGPKIPVGFYYAVLNNKFALAESRLDAIEDRALQLKREAASVSPPSIDSSSSGAADDARPAP